MSVSDQRTVWSGVEWWELRASVALLLLQLPLVLETLVGCPPPLPRVPTGAQAVFQVGAGSVRHVA